MYQNNPYSKTIGFIGAGKVGVSLGKYLSLNGFNVTEYYSRTLKSAEEAAEFIGGSCRAVKSISEMNCSVVLITVSDSAIEAICNSLQALGSEHLKDRIFCHTSGSLSADILSPLCREEPGAKIASLHMLLAVNDRFKSYTGFKDAFFTLDGSGAEEMLEIIKACGNKTKIIDAQCKPKYHAAAVFASNFVVGLAHIGCSLLTECGFTYDDALNALTPLIELNTENITAAGPKNAITGPVSRGDFETVKRHEQCLSGIPLEVYRVMTKALLDLTGQSKSDLLK